MQFTSTPSCRGTLYRDLQQCRLGTLALFTDIDDATFRCQIHPDYSPVGWHLGHIAFTESLWILEKSAGLAPLFPEQRRLWAADGLPKGDRTKLPTFPEVCHYLELVRTQVLAYLETAPVDQQQRLWRFIIQHESQHSEIISFLLQLIQKSRLPAAAFRLPAEPLPKLPAPEQIKIPAGEFEMGSNAIDALDNEQPAYRIYLDTYSIDRYPVTCGQYREFMRAGGYQNANWWSEAGWQWLQQHPVSQPLYWSDDSHDSHPVYGVSYYEAEAYANSIGKRLPTEAEWEKAARWDAAAHCSRTYPWGEEPPTPHHCNFDRIVGQTTPVNAYPAGQSAYGMADALGNVWEWTATWFDGYAGFVSYPYRGYSQTYFDGQHRVLKGASWATRPWGMRSSFRNWYYPGIRQILAGFRCASDAG